MANPPVLSKVHTFADDLNHVREARGVVAPKKVMTTVLPPTSPVTVATPLKTPIKKETKKATPIPTAKIAAEAKKATPVLKKTNIPPKLPSAPVKITASGNRDASYPATIITDKKRNSLNLTTAVSQALKEWWGAKLKSIEARKKPVYTVPTADRRKGIITAATSMTARSATMDHQEVVARLKAEQEQARSAVPPAAPIPAPHLHSTAPESIIAPAVTSSAWETAHTMTLDSPADTPNVTSPEEMAIETTVPIIEAALPVSITSVSDVISTPSETEPTEIPDLPTPAWTAVEETELEGTTETSEDETSYISDVHVEYYRQPNIVEDTTNYMEEAGDVVTAEEISETDAIIDTVEENEETEVVEEPELVSLAVDIPVTTPEPEQVFTPPQPVRIFPKITPIIPSLVAEKPLPEKSPAEPIITTIAPESAVTLLREELPPTLPATIRSVQSGVQARREALSKSARTVAPKVSRFPWHLAPYVVGIAFVCTTAGIITYFVIGNSTPVEETATPTSFPPGQPGGNNTTVPQTTGSIVIQPKGTSRTALYTELLLPRETASPYQIITALESTSGVPMTSRQILELMNRDFSADFIQNVTVTTLASYQGVPAIILSIAEESRAKGGMFLWEKTLGSDLSPWFGTPVPSSRTVSSLLSDFTDSAVGTHDVRILKDDTGAERITYGIINKRTILITTNSTTFANIADTYLSY